MHPPVESDLMCFARFEALPLELPCFISLECGVEPNKLFWSDGRAASALVPSAICGEQRGGDCWLKDPIAHCTPYVQQHSPLLVCRNDRSQEPPSQVVYAEYLWLSSYFLAAARPQVF